MFTNRTDQINAENENELKHSLYQTTPHCSCFINEEQTSKAGSSVKVVV